jgi:hypothetical protein
MENEMDKTINEKLDELLEGVQEIKDMLACCGACVEEGVELADDEFDPTDSDSLVEALQIGVYELTWNSASGVKIMKVTLDVDEVDDELALEEALVENSGNDYIKVWSPDRDGWRSFWITDIVDIVPVE